jgi:hypothetical protein
LGQIRKREPDAILAAGQADEMVDVLVPEASFDHRGFEDCPSLCLSWPLKLEHVGRSALHCWIDGSQPVGA